MYKSNGKSFQLDELEFIANINNHETTTRSYDLLVVELFDGSNDAKVLTANAMRSFESVMKPNGVLVLCIVARARDKFAVAVEVCNPSTCSHTCKGNVKSQFQHVKVVFDGGSSSSNVGHVVIFASHDSVEFDSTRVDLFLSRGEQKLLQNINRYEIEPSNDSKTAEIEELEELQKDQVRQYAESLLKEVNIPKLPLELLDVENVADRRNWAENYKAARGY
jgi:hypothetical protein